MYIQEGNGSVRFVSVPDFSKRNRFGSVRFGNVYFPVRRGLACVFRTRRGSVRFCSVRWRIRFRPVPELIGSVRPVRFGLSFLPVIGAARLAPRIQLHVLQVNNTRESTHRVLTPTRRLPPVRSFTLKHMHLCPIYVCFIRVVIIMIGATRMAPRTQLHVL